jgi:hypothetical protein
MPEAQERASQSSEIPQTTAVRRLQKQSWNSQDSFHRNNRMPEDRNQLKDAEINFNENGKPKLTRTAGCPPLFVSTSNLTSEVHGTLP